jgi:hypothetical protein
MEHVHISSTTAFTPGELLVLAGELWQVVGLTQPRPEGHATLRAPIVLQHEGPAHCCAVNVAN